MKAIGDNRRGPSAMQRRNGSSPAMATLARALAAAAPTAGRKIAKAGNHPLPGRFADNTCTTRRLAVPAN